jgi:hypothetical protein
MNPTDSSGAQRDRGQILVIFAMALVVMVTVTGLSVDVGGAFAQRRDQQTSADLAALAAANDYLINGDDALAIARARTVTADNGFTHGVGGTTVDVGIETSNGVEVTVDIDASHGNAFLAVIGMPAWPVTTSASALAGFPDSGEGAGPFIFSIGAFENDGTPKFQTPTNFGGEHSDNDRFPTRDADYAWTSWGPTNVSSSGLDAIIKGEVTIDRTLEYGQEIGQHNNGNHTSELKAVNDYLSGTEMPVAVVDGNGHFMGWAMFHVESASGGSDKHIRGYFLSSFTTGRLRVTACAANDCPRYLGSYVLKLSD